MKEVLPVRMPLLRSTSSLRELLQVQEEVVKANNRDKPRQRIISLHSSRNLNAEDNLKPSVSLLKPSSRKSVVISRNWIDDQIACISEPILLALETLLDRQVARFGITMFLELTDVDRAEIERLMSLSYEFEEAALVKFNRLRGLVVPPPGELLQKMLSKYARYKNGGMRRVNANNRLTSVSSTVPDPLLSAVQPQRSHARYVQCLANLSEPEQFRLSLLLSRQDQQHGLNMFEAITDADEPEIKELMQRRCRYEDVAYHFFQLKYPSGLPARQLSRVPSADDSRTCPAPSLSRSLSSKTENYVEHGPDEPSNYYQQSVAGSQPITPSPRSIMSGQQQRQQQRVFVAPKKHISFSSPSGNIGLRTASSRSMMSRSTSSLSYDHLDQQQMRSNSIDQLQQWQ